MRARINPTVNKKGSNVKGIGGEGAIYRNIEQIKKHARANSKRYAFASLPFDQIVLYLNQKRVKQAVQ